MKIAIDVRAAFGNKKGKGWYTYHVVKNILKIDQKNEYILYTNHIDNDFLAFPNATIKVINKKVASAKNKNILFLSMYFTSK